MAAPIRPSAEKAPWLTPDDRETIRTSVLSTPPGSIKLYSPDSRGLKFGSAGMLEGGGSHIIFGEVEPHFTVVDEDHPDLDALFRRNPRVVVVRDASRVYVDAETEREFGSKEELRAFQARRQPSAPRPVAVSRVSKPRAPTKGRSKSASPVVRGLKPPDPVTAP